MEASTGEFRLNASEILDGEPHVSIEDFNIPPISSPREKNRDPYFRNSSSSGKFMFEVQTSTSQPPVSTDDRINGVEQRLDSVEMLLRAIADHLRVAASPHSSPRHLHGSHGSGSHSSAALSVPRHGVNQSQDFTSYGEVIHATARIVKLSIKQASMLEQKVDAVVLPANNWLILSGGLAVAMKDMSGSKLQADCEAIIKHNNGRPLDLGEAAVTAAGGKLEASGVRHIIHAVPFGYETPSLKRIVPATPETVAKSVKSALELADEMGLRSIAFTAMACREGQSVIDRNPEQVMIPVMISTIKDFRPKKNLNEVVWCGKHLKT